MNPQIQQVKLNFYGLGIAPQILDTLDKMKFTVPTPIQHKTIPVANDGKDIIGVAQTGTGKTLAFSVPMVQWLAKKPGRGLVLAPTRELALQSDETLRRIAAPFGIKTAVIIGGAPMYLQFMALRKNPRIIIATPGRLIDHLDQQHMRLDDIVVLVIDEADRMLDLGFLPQIERILRSVPKARQTMLFSATIPGEIVNIARAYMKLPVSVEVAPSGTVAEKVIQEMFIVRKEEKTRLLQKIISQYGGTILLFARTKRGASKITRTIKNMGHNAAEIHSDRSLSQRREALEGFKRGKYRILVATDIAARGIDVTGIELVLNYDLPDDATNYLHRIGRTGRAGQAGRAISFAIPEQGGDVREIEKIIRMTVPISKHPGITQERFIPGARKTSGFFRKYSKPYRWESNVHKKSFK